MGTELSEFPGLDPRLKFPILVNGLTCPPISLAAVRASVTPLTPRAANLALEGMQVERCELCANSPSNLPRKTTWREEQLRADGDERGVVRDQRGVDVKRRCDADELAWLTCGGQAIRNGRAAPGAALLFERTAAVP